MIDAFRISRRLEIEYKVNGALHVLRHVPLIKKLLPADVYGKSWMKTVVLVVRIIGGFFALFFKKAIYLALMVALPCILLHENGLIADPAAAALHVFFFLTLNGTMVRNTVFDYSESMYYAVFLMRMNAREYALSNYFYFLVKDYVGMAVVIGILARAIPALALIRPYVLLLPLMVAGAKLAVSYLQLLYFRKRGAIFAGDESGVGKFTWILVLLLLAAGYLLPVIGWVIPLQAVIAACLVCAVLGAVSVILLFRANEYRNILKQVEVKSRGMVQMVEEPGNKLVKDMLLKKINEDSLSEREIGETGRLGHRYAFFNRLFVRRHRKVLTRTAKRQAIVLAAFFAAAAAACLIFPEFGGMIHTRLMGVLPVSLFVMYILNRGETITQVLFFNCDSSMMNYNFYRRPDVILGIFTERLKTLIRINLLPSGVIAAGLPLVYYLSGGTDKWYEYVVLAVTILAVSVFFSVHYLTMYYLLQPYTDGLAQKGVAYRIVMTMTYLVCYASMRIDAFKENSLLFGIVVCVFAVAYVVTALILTYRLAPKTFRLRR